MIAHSQSKSQVQAPQTREKKASAFVRAFRKSAAVLTISTAILFSGTINAQDNSKELSPEAKAKMETALKDISEKAKQAAEHLKKAEEAAKKEAEAKQKMLDICQNMLTILKKKDKECSEKPCDKETLSKIKMYWDKYNEDCPQLMTEIKK